MELDSTVTQRENAKANLKKVLALHHGDTKESAVIEAIANLSALNPTPNLAQNKALLEGNWLLISAPNFPGKLSDEGNRYVYTLGRLAFNKFAPANLKVSLERVSQPIFAREKDNEYSYDIVVEFKIIDEKFPELRGIVKNLAVCSFVEDDMVQVMFTGAELMPFGDRDPAQIEQWLEIFGSNQTKSQISLLERLQFWLVQTMFGMGKVTAIDSVTGKQSFAIKKSPKGKLKLLYLDEELRITKGNRESVLVCQRQI